MTDAADALRAETIRPATDWRLIVAVFWITAMVENIGYSQVYAFIPLYLREMGVPTLERLRFVGLFGALTFVVGAPLVPFWGVWADKYSRKAIIVRSAIINIVVFGGVAMSREPWQLAGCLLLNGLQLGNTGVMLATIRDVTPRRRLGTIIAGFAASGPIGAAIGPAIGGIIVDGAHLGLPVVFWSSVALSVINALVLCFAIPEVRPEVIPSGRVLDLAFGAVRGILSDRTILRIFALFGLVFLGTQMSRPFIPVLVEHVNGDQVPLASAIALVTGTAALLGALLSPVGGWLSDRIGFRTVLIGALIIGGASLAMEPVVPSVATLAIVVVVFGAATTAASAMVVGLVVSATPAERRSSTLNLVYVPAYAAGIVGPTLGAIVVTGGLGAPFWLGGTIYLAGALVMLMRFQGRPAVG